MTFVNHGFVLDIYICRKHESTVLIFTSRHKNCFSTASLPLAKFGLRWLADLTRRAASQWSKTQSKVRPRPCGVNMAEKHAERFYKIWSKFQKHFICLWQPGTVHRNTRYFTLPWFKGMYPWTNDISQSNVSTLQSSIFIYYMKSYQGRISKFSCFYIYLIQSLFNCPISDWSRRKMKNYNIRSHN